MIDINYIEKTLVVLISFIGVWLAVWVCGANKKEKLNQWFALMTFFVVLWVNFACFGFGAKDAFSAVIFYRLNSASVALFLVSFYCFYVLYFLKEKGKHLILEKFILATGILLAFSSLFTGFIIKETVIQDWGAEIIFGAGNDLFNLYALLVSLLVVGFLIKKYVHLSKNQKIKVQYFLTGTFFFVLFNIIFNVVFPAITETVEYQHFGDYSAIILLIFTAYAITKHNLMGIKTLLTQTLIVVIAIILLLDIFALSDNLTMQILKMGILIAFLYFSRGMVESVKKEKQAREELQKTYRKVNRYAKKLEKANQDLKELLESKDDFLHITSHQLRTPLTVIRGMLAMWRAGDFDGLSEEEREKMKEKIYFSAERLNNVTNDMLDAMEVEGKFLKFNLKTASLEDVVREVMDGLKPNYDKKRLHLKLNVKGKLPKIKLEPKYFKQALMNLLDNAEKYTLRGGAEINIYPTAFEKGGENEFVLIEIKDTGIGIDKRDQKKLFQKFSRTGGGVKQNITGSGLGLFIAKQIIDEHEGKIEISSEGAGKGTTVKVWLPKT